MHMNFYLQFPSDFVFVIVGILLISIRMGITQLTLDINPGCAYP